ncbi:MAG TPA: L,D-transpeptidase family protein [Marmoricola sp.]|nr:L,D-transpeptidase family protein [Marmoricola sp.]
MLVAISGLGFGVASLSSAYGSPESTHRTTHVQPAITATPTPQPTPTPTVAPTPQVLPASEPLTPDPALLKQGDTGPRVRVVQARLRQLGWYAGTVTNRYNPRTTAAVRGFQVKRKLPVTGSLDRPTLQRLRAMTHRPTRDELANRTVSGQGGGGAWTTAALDSRCRTGRVLCVDKTSRTIRWVVGGEVRKTMAVRFGAAYTPTREGVFHVTFKSRDHVSTLYNTPMPFAMFFSGGQAVHYSSDFAARGYAGASHGCVNVRDYNGIKWLFDQVRVGDKVVIYWS